jgi:hypothetical protein
LRKKTRLDYYGPPFSIFDYKINDLDYYGPNSFPTYIQMQTSGAISMSDIASEFGGSTPHALGEYYGVSDNLSSTVGTRPISFDQVYGQSSSNIKACYAMRKVIHWYQGPHIRVKRSSDAAELDVTFDQWGRIDATYTSWIGADTPYVVIWYDQSGRNHHMSMISDPELQYVDGEWCVNYNGSGQYGTADGTVAGSVAATVVNVGFENNNPKCVWTRAYHTGHTASTYNGMFSIGDINFTGGQFSLVNLNNSTWRAQFWSTPDFDFTFDGLNAWHDYTVTSDGGRQFAYIDGDLQKSEAYTLVVAGSDPFKSGRWRLNTETLQGKISSHILFGQHMSIPKSIWTSYRTPMNRILHLDAAEYSGSGTWTDLMGNSNATPANAPVHVSTTPQHITFNGSTQYFDLQLQNPAGAWAHSISFWMRIDVDTIVGETNPFQFGTTPSAGQYLALAVFDDGRIQWYFFNNDVRMYVSNPIKKHTWMHICLTYNGGTSINDRHIYYNSEEQTITPFGTITAPNFPANMTGSLGRDRGRNQAYFPGSIAQFSVYSRALEANEVRRLYEESRREFLIDGLLRDDVTAGGGWVAVKYLYDTTTTPINSDTHNSTTNYYVGNKLTTLFEAATDILFREDSSSTLAVCASRSAFDIVRRNVLTGHAWFKDTHGTNTLDGWLVPVDVGTYIPDARLGGCDNYDDVDIPIYQVFNTCGNNLGTRTTLLTTERLRDGYYTDKRVHSIWLRIRDLPPLYDNYFGRGTNGVMNITSDTQLTVPNTNGSYDGDMVVVQATTLTIQAGATLTTAQPCRGLLVYVIGDCHIYGTLSMTARGAAANPTVAGASDNAAVSASGLQIPLYTESPYTSVASSADLFAGCGTAARTAIAQHGVSEDVSMVTIQRSGAAGGAQTASGSPVIPNNGSNGSVGQSGGGGSGGGGSGGAGGSGSAGTCFSGGSGGGGAHPGVGGAASLNGGAGGEGNGSSSFPTPGGIGNPNGEWSTGGYVSLNGIENSTGGTGGLLILVCGGTVTVHSGGSIESHGVSGPNFGGGDRGGGGASGGGNVVVAHRGDLVEDGSVACTGGASWGWSTTQKGGAGGNGSVQRIKVR